MVSALTLAALVFAQAPAGQAYVLDPARSAIRFQVVHPLHKVNGEAKVFEARALAGEDGVVRAMVRIQVASMQTGDANRDANLRESLQSDRYPYVVAKATSAFTRPASYPATEQLQVKGEIDLHGVKRPLEMPLRVAFDEAGSARLTGTVALSLDAHGIERPSLLFRKIDDRCNVEIDLLLRPEKK